MGFNRSHLNFVDGLPFLQSLGPHRDARLVVGQTPALLAQTLGLKAGECPVVRDGHSLSRHGLLPGEGGRGQRQREEEGVGGLRRDSLAGPERTR